MSIAFMLMFVIVLLCCHGSVCTKSGKYKMILFSVNDIHLNPLPRTNKFVITDDNITILAQATPVLRADASGARNTALVRHFNALGLSPHLTLFSVDRTLELPFAMELFSYADLLAWRCSFNRSILQHAEHVHNGQWGAVLSLSHGSGFLYTEASVTDLSQVRWASVAWGLPVDTSVVAGRALSLHHLQDPCGSDVGLLYAVTGHQRPGLFVATLVGNKASWYDMAHLTGLRAALNGTSGGAPSHLTLISAVLTSDHLILLTSAGLLISPSLRDLRHTSLDLEHLNFTRADLNISPSTTRGRKGTWNGTAAGDNLKSDELVHSLSCFVNPEYDEEVLLLQYAEQRFLIGRRPFQQAQSWRDIKQFVQWPSSLTSVRDMRYNWHWRALFVGYLQNGKYATTVLPLKKDPATETKSVLFDFDEPFVKLCPITKKIYLFSGAMYVSTDSDGSFDKSMSRVMVNEVRYCDSDLNKYHACVTDSLELIIISVGADVPHLVDLKSVARLNTTDAKKTAMFVDRAGGLTIYSVGNGYIGSQHFHLQNELDPNRSERCGYRLELLGAFKHMSYFYLDVHDVVTVAAEARAVYNEGTPVVTDAPLVELELSNPTIVEVQRSVSVHNNSVRYTAVVRPRSWRMTGVCAVIFRLPHSSALCAGNSRMVSFALSSAPHHSLRVDWPPGQNPTVPDDVQRNVRQATDLFYLLPVNYRPPSDLGVSIPTSANIYNADPTMSINHGLLMIHSRSLNSARFKQCAGKRSRAECGCTEQMVYSADVMYSDCRRYVRKYMWPAKLFVKLSIRGMEGHTWPLEAPMYVTISELNNRSSWENHVLLDADLSLIYMRALGAGDRKLVDPQRVRILMGGTGLYHFRLSVAEHASYNNYYTDLQVFVVPARLMAPVQDVVYPLVGISLIICIFVVFEYYQQRTKHVEEQYSDSEESIPSATEVK